MTFAESALRRLRVEKNHLSDRVRLKKDIHDELPKTPHRSSERNKNKIDKINYLMSGLQLPKVELGFFDGNPVNYLKFIKQFEYYVETKGVDLGQRLLQLMHYCRGRTREAIGECILLPPMQHMPELDEFFERIIWTTTRCSKDSHIRFFDTFENCIIQQ